MSTLAKTKKTAPKKPVLTMKKLQRAASHGFAISPVTGLPFKPLARGQKPVSREILKAALAESL